MKPLDSLQHEILEHKPIQNVPKIKCLTTGEQKIQVGSAREKISVAKRDCLAEPRCHCKGPDLHGTLLHLDIAGRNIENRR